MSFVTNSTAKFAVLDLASVKVQHVEPEAAEDDKAAASKAAGRVKQRLNKESGAKIKDGGGQRIGGDFQRAKNPAYLGGRSDVFDRVKAVRDAEISKLPRTDITVTLPDGKTQAGVSFETTPFDVAKSISQGLADAVICAKVKYSERVQSPLQVTAEDDGMEVEAGDGDGELWDLTRPLEGSCEILFLKFDDKEGKTVFWHSSAHMLGEALEHLYGSLLTIGPPLENGFYYDSYMGLVEGLSEADFKAIDKEVASVIKKKQKFERLVVTKEECLELFAYNPFKTQLISTKLPDGCITSVYRCGDLIDLCRGPHLPNTGKVKAYQTLSASGTNWLGKTDNDPLQRVYGVSFPDKKQLKQYIEDLEEAKKRDHRTVGVQQKLFMFHDLSPGSCMWLPHGARIYNKLIDFIKGEYRKRGYDEVITPNMYNADLWRTSGHWEHYADDMFTFDIEEQDWALKPMNCPGHCLMFGSTLRSWRDLPMRFADFGVLHRNEASGALTGLTRVRRFQQDDAHIFCMRSQIKDEVLGALNFMKHVYDIFGMGYQLQLSTRPEKALGGSDDLWNEAESALAQAMDEFSGPGSWKLNPGDGAFYGPKIDIKVMDTMHRLHQCATVQLDFQLPIRFGLKFKTAAGGAAGDDAAEDAPGVFERPVIIHRAMLGSVERMTAILIEHFGGKWPFWLSPRQVSIVPVAYNDDVLNEYCNSVKQRIHEAGFYVDVDLSGDKMQKKIRNFQQDRFNYILVCGRGEMEKGTVNIRLREATHQGADGKMTDQLGEMSLDAAIALFQSDADAYK